GRKESAVDHPQVREVMRLAPRIKHTGRRVVPGNDRAALMAVHADVEHLGRDDVIACGSKQPSCPGQKQTMSTPTNGGPRGRDRAVPAEGDTVVGGRQILGHHQPFDAAASDLVEQPERYLLRPTFHHDALYLADQLHCAQRKAISTVVIPVVDRHRLLEYDV